MKKIYGIGIIILLVTAAFGISKFYLSLQSDDIQETVAVSKTPEPEKKTPVIVSKTDFATTAPVSEEKHPAPAVSVSQPITKPVVTAEIKPVRPDYIDDLWLALEAGDEFAVQTAIESAAACDTCIYEMMKILDDPNYDKTFRKHIASSLMKSGNPEGVLSVVKSIVAAHKEEDFAYKDQLLQIFADSNSPQTADALADILTGKSSFSSELQEIPEDVVYAIKKSIRLTPDENVGETLAQKYVEASSQEEQKVLSEINHPVMIARLAADAYEQKDTETADRFMEQLAEVEDQAAIKGIMMLAKENSVPLETVTNMISFWQSAQPDNAQTHDIFVEYLSNHQYTPEERAVAAYAIGYEKNSDLAVSALRKAQLHENDPTVKRYIEDVLAKTAN